VGLSYMMYDIEFAKNRYVNAIKYKIHNFLQLKQIINVEYVTFSYL
jgi:hypothetical protein